MTLIESEHQMLHPCITVNAGILFPQTDEKHA